MNLNLKETIKFNNNFSNKSDNHEVTQKFTKDDDSKVKKEILSNKPQDTPKNQKR